MSETVSLTEWPPLKKALWDVVTAYEPNARYVNAWELTEKLYQAALAVDKRGSYGWLIIPEGLREDDWSLAHDPDPRAVSLPLHLSPDNEAYVTNLIESFSSKPHGAQPPTKSANQSI
jgi:hypothetical protein